MSSVSHSTVVPRLSTVNIRLKKVTRPSYVQDDTAVPRGLLSGPRGLLMGMADSGGGLRCPLEPRDSKRWDLL